MSKELESRKSLRRLKQRSFLFIFPVYLLISVEMYFITFRSLDYIVILFMSLGLLIASIVRLLGRYLVVTYYGWTIVSLSLFSLAVRLPNRSYAVYRKTYSPLGGLTAVPSHKDQSTTSKRIVILLGGPIANLLIGIYLIFLSKFVSHMNTPYISFNHIVFGWALINFFFFADAIIPVRRTSGWLVLQLLRGRSTAEGVLSIAWIYALVGNHVRLRDLPSWMIEDTRASEAEDGFPTKFAKQLDIGRVLDSERVDARLARELIDKYRAEYGADEWLSACDAYLAAVWESDLERAAAALPDDITPTIPVTFAAQAAIAACRGQERDARAKLVRMSKEAKRYSPFRSPMYEDLRVQVEGLLAR